MHTCNNIFLAKNDPVGSNPFCQKNLNIFLLQITCVQSFVVTINTKKNFRFVREQQRNSFNLSLLFGMDYWLFVAACCVFAVSCRAQPIQRCPRNRINKQEFIDSVSKIIIINFSHISLYENLPMQ